MTNQIVTRLVALSLTVVALAIPALASASPQPALGTYHAEGPDGSLTAILGPERTPGTSEFVAAQSAGGSTVTASADPGFSWGDAALGGAAVLAIGIVGAGALLVVRGYRNGEPRVRTS